MNYKNIIILFTIIIIVLQNLIQFLFNDNEFVNRYIISSLKQYTIWNFCLLLINIFLFQDSFMEIFMFINSFIVFIGYYIIHIVYRNKIKLFPNIPSFFTETHIEIIMFVLHGMPFIYYLFKYLNSNIDILYNFGYETMIFNIIWSLLSFFSLDPSPVYFEINNDFLYFIWFIILLLHIIYGYCLVIITPYKNKYISL